MSERPLPTQAAQYFPTSQRLSVGGPPFNNIFDEQTVPRVLPVSNEATEKTNFVPPILALILGSTYFLITLCIILIVPILELAIGLAYQNQCTIEPNIPKYLIVSGACGIATIGLTLIIVVALIFCVKEGTICASLVTGCVIMAAVGIIMLMSFFLFIWFIVGNVWVFRAKSSVDFDNIFSPYYCHSTLYNFAFWILILTYIGTVVGCCVSCARACFQATTSLKA